MSCTPILQVPTLGLHKMLPSLVIVAAGSGLIIHKNHHPQECTASHQNNLNLSMGTAHRNFGELFF
jgi:hypothetical protein